MKIGIIGLGLIGGSIGLKLQSLDHIVYGITNNEFNKKRAEERKLANVVSCDYQLLKDCSLIILALPIEELVNPSENLINSIPLNIVLTDVGSIKDPIVKQWEKSHPLFVGSHPMAGTEKKGVNAGCADLFDNAKWIITPTAKTKKKGLDTLTKLISSMNCDLCFTSPILHDQSVALISHLPIYLASCLIDTANTEENKELLNLSYKIASTGFSDTSRVGGGNPKLGIDLAMNNSKNILKSLKTYRENIYTLEQIIKNKNWEVLLNKLNYSMEIRNRFVNKKN